MQDLLTIFKLTRKVKVWVDCKKKFKSYILKRLCTWKKKSIFNLHVTDKVLGSDPMRLRSIILGLQFYVIYKNNTSPDYSQTQIPSQQMQRSSGREAGRTSKQDCIWVTSRLSQENLSTLYRHWTQQDELQEAATPQHLSNWGVFQPWGVGHIMGWKGRAFWDCLSFGSMQVLTETKLESRRGWSKGL